MPARPLNADILLTRESGRLAEIRARMPKLTRARRKGVFSIDQRRALGTFRIYEVSNSIA